MLQATLHALRHSMHDLAWRHQKSIESQLAVNQLMIQRLSSPTPTATAPRQPAHPPPESLTGRKAPAAPPAAPTDPGSAASPPPPKLQPRVTSANKPPGQPRTRTPPPANKPPAQSAKDTPAQRLLCAKPNNAVPPKQLPPQGRGRPRTDCHLHHFLVVIQQSCSLH